MVPTQLRPTLEPVLKHRVFTTPKYHKSNQSIGKPKCVPFSSCSTLSQGYAMHYHRFALMPNCLLLQIYFSGGIEIYIRPQHTITLKQQRYYARSVMNRHVLALANHAFPEQAISFMLGLVVWHCLIDRSYEYSCLRAANSV